MLRLEFHRYFGLLELSTLKQDFQAYLVHQIIFEIIFPQCCVSDVEGSICLWQVGLGSAYNKPIMVRFCPRLCFLSNFLISLPLLLLFVLKTNPPFFSCSEQNESIYYYYYGVETINFKFELEAVWSFFIPKYFLDSSYYSTYQRIQLHSIKSYVAFQNSASLSPILCYKI